MVNDLLENAKTHSRQLEQKMKEGLQAGAEAERRLCLAKSMKSILSIPMVSGCNPIEKVVVPSIQ